MFRLLRLIALFMLAVAAPAAAAVELTFYSKELGTSFPTPS